MCQRRSEGLRWSPPYTKDHDRLRMDRLLVREEHEGRLVVEGHGGGRYLRRLLGFGVDWTRPADQPSQGLARQTADVPPRANNMLTNRREWFDWGRGAEIPKII